MNKFAQDELNWLLAKDDLQLTELEKSLLTLAYLTRYSNNSNNNYEGLKFKAPYTYITEDGYLLGSMVWYLPCKIGGQRVKIYGRTPEQAVQSAIRVFADTQNLRDIHAVDEYINKFKREQESLATTYRRRD